MKWITRSKKLVEERYQSRLKWAAVNRKIEMEAVETVARLKDEFDRKNLDDIGMSKEKSSDLGL